jgi:hypothetical protein
MHANAMTRETVIAISAEGVLRVIFWALLAVMVAYVAAEICGFTAEIDALALKEV